MKKNQKFCNNWTLNFSSTLTEESHYHSLVKESQLKKCNLDRNFALLCTLYYLWHGTEMFSDDLLLIGATVLSKRISKSFTYVI